MPCFPAIESRNPPLRLRRRAFSLVQMLIVIGIVVTLLGLITIGAARANRQAKEKLSRQHLANCRAMLAEFERVSFLKDISTAAIAAPGKVSEGGADRNGPAVRETRAMMARLRSLPSNRATLEQLPPSTVWGGATALEGPLLLDGFNNPILFVPANGLTGVRTKAGTVTVSDPDHRPFFASAGEDGDFQAGDDNLYSFER
jgi:type II secretory pathway pseudopilin PulG